MSSNGELRVVVVGGHGQIALILLRLLAEQGHRPVGLIRNPSHAADLEAVGAEPLVFDLEQQTAAALAEPYAGPMPWSSRPEPARTAGRSAS